jgi:hypothetical protein
VSQLTHKISYKLLESVKLMEFVDICSVQISVIILELLSTSGILGIY